MSGWAWVLVLLLPAGWLRLLGHELSHAVAVWVTGGMVVWPLFKPWPHKVNGRWMWGSMGYIGGDELFTHIAPLGRATCMLLAWCLWAFNWPPLLVFAFWELTDVLHWWRGWIWQPDSDGGKTRALLRKGRL